MTGLWPIGVVLAASAVAMFAGWLGQRRSRNAGIVDVIWTFAMAGAAVFYAVVGKGALSSRVLLAVLAATWGVRLGVHLASRVAREPEDGRYRYLREYWRDDQGKFFAFFMAQALLTALLSVPFFAAAQNPDASYWPWKIAAILVFGASIGGETIADRELAAFRAAPANRGKTCRTGLWRYSRHPNYFFEWMHWFTYVLLSIGAGGLAWFAILGPVLMLTSLCWITGIPFAEAQALRSRGDEYRAYQRTTSAFVPCLRRATTPELQGARHDD